MQDKHRGPGAVCRRQSGACGVTGNVCAGASTLLTVTGRTVSCDNYTCQA